MGVRIPFHRMVFAGLESVFFLPTSAASSLNLTRRKGVRPQ